MNRRPAFPGVSSYRDRHGRRQWRFRSKGLNVHLGAEWGSAEFRRRYELARQGQRPNDPKRLEHGTLSWLVARYYQSAEYRRLAERTQYVYRNTLERLREDHGARSVKGLQPKHVRALMQAKADAPNAANFTLRMLHTLMQHAIDLGVRDDDPTANVRKYKTGGGFYTWQEHDIARFYEVHKPGSTAHLAMTLMLYTGAARVDACAMGWANVRDGRVQYRRAKTARTTGTLIDIPLHAELVAALEHVPPGRFTFLETGQGRARSSNGLGNAMRRWCDEAGLSECTAHGLRKACARRLAEAGATPSMIAAVTGHATLKEVARYTADANRTALADEAMDRLGVAAPNRPATVANHPKRFATTSPQPHEKARKS